MTVSTTEEVTAMDARPRLTQMRAIRRLAAKDATLFADPVVAADRLGWIGLPQAAAEQAATLAAFGAEIAASDITDVVLVGMGGSSLAPLVLARVFGHAAGHPALHVLDTTSPHQVLALLATLSPATTLVVVSSKSGTTIEPLSLASVLRDWMEAALGDAVGSHFMAITDPGSPLDDEARASGFSRVFRAPDDVGGRYAALTPFATVPAALAGFDVALLAASAIRAETACGIDDGDNPGASLAAWLADAYSEGRDKLTIVVSERYDAFGLWVEQLVAESTGKRGAGILPVLEDAPGDPTAHGDDRMTFILRAPEDEALAGLAARLPSGEPVFEMVLRDAHDLGGEFVRWEWAVALFSALSAIEPFDQPNVAEAKAASEAILREGAPDTAPSVIEVGGPGLGTAGTESLAPMLGTMLTAGGAGSYLAVLAYLPDDPALLAPLREACAALADSLHIPVTFELGPRYLHSTGQYHKGGPSTGIFLVLTAGSAEDVRIRGKSYTLGVLNRAQATGDVVTLSAHGRPVLRVTLPDAGSAHLQAVADALCMLAGSRDAG
jgi:glucose-6-phosphate isomerase